jgi:hypothetical protein
MPHKTPKPRKPGLNPLSTQKNRRVVRPDPAGGARAPVPTGLRRDKRFDRRPPKFPGRLGGR